MCSFYRCLRDSPFSDSRDSLFAFWRCLAQRPLYESSLPVFSSFHAFLLSQRASSSFAVVFVPPAYFARLFLTYTNLSGLRSSLFPFFAILLFSYFLLLNTFFAQPCLAGRSSTGLVVRSSFFYASGFLILLSDLGSYFCSLCDLFFSLDFLLSF